MPVVDGPALAARAGADRPPGPRPGLIDRYSPYTWSAISSTSSSRVATYRYRDAGAVPMAAAAERIVTAARPLVSASATPAAAISARLCSGAGPRADRSGRAQMLCRGPLQLLSSLRTLYSVR